MINIDMSKIERISIKQTGIGVLQIIPTRKTNNETWSKEIKALAGSWADFPSLVEIRSNKGVD